MGTYNLDSHNCQRYVDAAGHAANEGDVQESTHGAYVISYRSIVPRRGEAENLLVPICISASHIAYGSIRMEPVFMILAESATEAAVLALDEKIPVQKVNYAKLRARLLADKQVLDWTNATPARAAVSALKLDGLVLDDRDAAKAGDWVESSVVGHHVGPGYVHDGNGHKGEMTVTFTPTIPAPGEYELVLISTPNANRASNVPVTVSIVGNPGRTIQEKVVRVNERFASTHSLGRFELPSGQGTKVIVSNRDTDGFVVVDGLQVRAAP
jgi:hypothetical protein